MTGGRMSAEQREYPRSPRLQIVRSEDEQYVDQVLRAWVRVMRFARQVRAALRSQGLSFALFRVLEATDRSQRELRDAVSQQDVVHSCGLCKSSVCSLMRTLERRGLVDIGVDEWGFAHRIIVTTSGRASLAAARHAVLTAAQNAGLPK
jgi:DNA-binding MarR family transcriptional regulator